MWALPTSPVQPVAFAPPAMGAVHFAYRGIPIRCALPPSPEQQILDSYRCWVWKWDEGPDVGGPQRALRVKSERSAIYHPHSEQSESAKAMRSAAFAAVSAWTAACEQMATKQNTRLRWPIVPVTQRAQVAERVGGG